MTSESSRVSPPSRYARIQGHRDEIARARNDEQLRAALLPLARVLAREGEWTLALVAMKRLRKLGDARPSDHRRVFDLFRQAGRADVIERYLDLLERRGASAGDWARTGLALWAGGRDRGLADLLRTRPSGTSAGANFVKKVAAASLALDDPRFGLTALAAADALEPGAARKLNEILSALWRHVQRAVADDPIAAADATSAPALPPVMEEREPLRRRHARVMPRALRSVQPHPFAYAKAMKTMRNRGDEALIERYLQRVRRSPLTSGNAVRVFLMLWAGGDTGHLAAVLDKGMALIGTASPRIVERCLEMSLARRDHDVVATLLAGVAASEMLAPGQAVRMGEVALREKAFLSALRLAERALGRRPDDVAAVALRRAAAEGALDRLADEISSSVPVGATALVARLEAIVGPTPLVRHVRQALQAWTVPDATAPPERPDRSGSARTTRARAPVRGQRQAVRSPSLPELGNSSHGIVAGVERRLAALSGKGARSGGPLAGLLEAMKSWREHGPLDEAEAQVEEFARPHPALIDVFARYLAETKRSAEALDRIGALRPAALTPDAWLWWARTAGRLGARPALLLYCRNAAAGGGAKGTRNAAACLIDLGMADDAIALWREAGSGLGTLYGLLRALRALERIDAVQEEAIVVVARSLPAARLALPEQEHFVAIVRLLTNFTVSSRAHAALADRLDRADLPEGSDALSLWAKAALAAACLDQSTATSLLERARGLELPPSLALSIDHEIAALHMRYNRVGAARRQLLGVGPLSDKAKGYYDKLFALLPRLDAVTPHAEFYPECLVDLIFDRVAVHRPSRAPSGTHVVTVTASLSHGGGERQTVTIVKALCDEPAISGQSLVVRSVDGKLGFFAGIAGALPIEMLVYGDDWRQPTRVAAVAHLLPDDPALLAALDLLPHTVREDVLRIIPILHERGPAAVHIRQDLYAPAIAAALVGVPVFFVHRGSLARDTWVMTPREREIGLRPLRHAYRRLFQDTHFFIVNNSEVGRQSDIDWLAPPDAARIQVVHNAVDFAELGEETGANVALRTRLGIPLDAPVVGAMFRIEAVKRPLLWMEAAAIIARARPDTHFVVAGGGRMQEAMAGHAADLGLADRVHFPGPVNRVGEWYRLMDVFLLTSEREGLPNVLIEAQHFGVPVVSSEVGGARATLRPGLTGYLVDADAGADAFARAVLAIIRDGEWRADARRLGPDYVHQAFGSAQAIRRLTQLYGLREVGVRTGATCDLVS